MTAQTPTLSMDAIDAALAAATPGLDGGGRRLAAAVLRLLAAGEPVSVPRGGCRRRDARLAGRAADAVVAWCVLGRSRPGSRALGPVCGAHAAPLSCSASMTPSSWPAATPPGPSASPPPDEVCAVYRRPGSCLGQEYRSVDRRWGR